MNQYVAALRIFAALAVVGASGCATIIKGSGRDVIFTSSPPGANIFVQGKYIGKTPVMAKVDHGYSDRVVEARLPGYRQKQAILTTHFSGHSLWLLYVSAPIDALTGSMFTVDDGALHLELEPSGEPLGPAIDPRYAQRYAAQPVRSPPRQSMASAAAQLGNKRLAVLEFQGKSMDQDILMTFSDTIRGGALQGLEGYGVVVMTRENMLVLLRDMGKQECGEGDCEVETARNIGADYVISGKVVRIEQLYVVTLKLHETQGGSLLGTETVEGASQVELMRSLREHGRQLTSAAFGSREVSR
jgi:TolB-like protein